TRAVITTWVRKGTVPEFSHGRTDSAYFVRFNSFGNRVVTEFGLRTIGEAVVEPVVATFARAPPDNHARSIPARGVIRTGRRGAGQGYRRPFVGGRIESCARADRVAGLIGASP